jgi:hypothetical protein
MNLIDRIKGILLDPRNEWPKIAAEPATVQSLYTGWIMILAAIGPLALLLSMHSIQIAIAQYVLALILTFVLALIVDALAPSFGGTKDFVASLKLTPPDMGSPAKGAAKPDAPAKPAKDGAAAAPGEKPADKPIKKRKKAPAAEGEGTAAPPPAPAAAPPPAQ